MTNLIKEQLNDLLDGMAGELDSITLPLVAGVIKDLKPLEQLNAIQHVAKLLGLKTGQALTQLKPFVGEEEKNANAAPTAPYAQAPKASVLAPNTPMYPTVKSVYPQAPINALATLASPHMPQGISPIFIKRILKGIPSEGIPEQMEIVFENFNGEWDTILIKKSVFTDAGKFKAALSDAGYMGIMDDDGKSAIFGVTKFLNAYEKYNRKNKTMDESETFLSLGFDEKLARFVYSGAGGYDVLAPGKDEQKMLGGYVSKGDLHQAPRFVRDAINWSKGYSIPTVIFITGFAAKILPIVGCSPFMLEIANTTGAGKSLSQYMALAIDGDPKKLKAQWSSSYASLEPVLAFTKNHMFALEDAQNQDDIKVITDIIYQYFNEQGKGRATNNGQTRGTKNFHGIITSSSESPSYKLIKKEGIARRLMTVTDSPFGDVAAKKGEEYEKIVNRYHGIAGPAFVQYMLEHEDEWDVWKSDYNQLKNAYHKELNRQTVTELDKERMKFMNGYLAAIHFTMRLVEDCFNVTVGIADVMNDFAEKVYTAMVGENSSVKALKEFESFIAMNRDRHFSGGNINQAQYGVITDSYVGVVTAAMDKFFKEIGYEKQQENILTNWEKDGLFHLDKEGRRTQKTTFKGLLYGKDTNKTAKEAIYPHMYRIDMPRLQELLTATAGGDANNNVVPLADAKATKDILQYREAQAAADFSKKA